jgi:hypothetical protein
MYVTPSEVSGLCKTRAAHIRNSPLRGQRLGDFVMLRLPGQVSQVLPVTWAIRTCDVENRRALRRERPSPSGNLRWEVPSLLGSALLVGCLPSKNPLGSGPLPLQYCLVLYIVTSFCSTCFSRILCHVHHSGQCYHVQGLRWHYQRSYWQVHNQLMTMPVWHNFIGGYSRKASKFKSSNHPLFQNPWSSTLFYQTRIEHIASSQIQLGKLSVTAWNDLRKPMVSPLTKSSAARRTSLAPMSINITKLSLPWAQSLHMCPVQ